MCDTNSGISMKTFSIKEIENLTGIKAHTLRVWERRHDLLKPERTPGKGRLYSIKDLHKTFHLYLLTKYGYKVSLLATFSDEELTACVQQLKDENAQYENAVHILVLAMHRLETEQFSVILDACLDRWKTAILLDKVIFSFLLKTGLLWTGSRLMEEHFVVTAIRNKIIRGIEEINTHEQNSKRILLFLPASGQLDLLLLYTQYMLKAKGFRVLYMGNDVTMSNLEAIIQLRQPDCLFTYLPKKTNFNIAELSSLMKQMIPQARLIIVKNPAFAVQEPVHHNVLFLDHAAALSAVCE